jgi:hypothetical protein
VNSLAPRLARGARLKRELFVALSGASLALACAGRSERRLPATAGGAGEPAANDGGGGARGGGAEGGAATGALGGRASAGEAPVVGGTRGTDDAGRSGGGAPGGRAAVGGAGGGGNGGEPFAGAGGASGTTAGAGGRSLASPGCTATGSYGPGLEACSGAFVHRTSAMTCPHSPHDATWSESSGGEAGATTVVHCQDDADCLGIPNGYCVASLFTPTPPSGVCQSTCETDADCGPDFVCSCDPGNYTAWATKQPLKFGVCSFAQCVTDADCTPGLLCISASTGSCGPTTPRYFHCQSPTDQCNGPDDCGEPDLNGTWSCQQGSGGFLCVQAHC